MTPETLKRKAMAVHPDRVGGSTEKFLAAWQKYERALGPKATAAGLDRVVLTLVEERPGILTPQLAAQIGTSAWGPLTRLERARAIHSRRMRGQAAVAQPWNRQPTGRPVTAWYPGQPPKQIAAGA